MLSLAGHPSLPSLRNSMRHPEHFEGMLDGSFVIMFVVYVAMAVFGFLSFGDASAVLVTENLRRSAHSAASRLLNKVVIFFVALSSASTVPPLIAVTAEMYDDIIDNLRILRLLEREDGRPERADADADAKRGAKGAAGRERAEEEIHAAGAPGHLAICLKRSFVLLLAFAVSALCADYLGTFESVFGGICAINGSMILPALFYLMLVGARLPRGQRARLIGVVGLGLVMLVSIFVMNVYDVAEH